MDSKYSKSIKLTQNKYSCSKEEKISLRECDLIDDP